MENEELAALRATLRAAERLPEAARSRQHRLSAALADGDDLLPYVLARSCSDPRDRVVHEPLSAFRILEGGPPAPRSAATYEPPPTRPSRLALALALFAVCWLVIHVAGLILLLR